MRPTLTRRKAERGQTAPSQGSNPTSDQDKCCPQDITQNPVQPYPGASETTNSLPIFFPDVRDAQIYSWKQPHQPSMTNSYRLLRAYQGRDAMPRTPAAAAHLVHTASNTIPISRAQINGSERLSHLAKVTARMQHHWVPVPGHDPEALSQAKHPPF